MVNVGAKVEGLEVFLRAIGKAKSKDAIAVAEGLEKAANVILKKSQIYVPVESGDLKKSGHVEVEGKGMGAKATVVYDADYAVFVHEDLEAKHTPPTCAKYVERAVRETRGTTASICKRELEIGR